MRERERERERERASYFGLSNRDCGSNPIKLSISLGS